MTQPSSTRQRVHDTDPVLLVRLIETHCHYHYTQTFSQHTAQQSHSLSRLQFY
jgi:hypothetical protein